MDLTEEHKEILLAYRDALEASWELQAAQEAPGKTPRRLILKSRNARECFHSMIYSGGDFRRTALDPICSDVGIDPEMISEVDPEFVYSDISP